MAVLISDSDNKWREYQRLERFLIFIWRRFVKAKSDRVTLILVLFFFAAAFFISTFWK